MIVHSSRKILITILVIKLLIKITTEWVFIYFNIFVTDKSKGNNENMEKVFVQVIDVNDNIPKPLNESRVLTLCQNNHNKSQVNFNKIFNIMIKSFKWVCVKTLC